MLVNLRQMMNALRSAAGSSAGGGSAKNVAHWYEEGYISLTGYKSLTQVATYK